MSDLNKKIADLASNSSQSSWKEKVEWRRANKDWLRKSSEVALRILDALDDLDWNKARLAKELGVSAQQVSRYVKGEENFKLETLCKLEKVLGVQLSTVLHEDEEVVKKGTWKYVESNQQLTEIEIGKKELWSYSIHSSKGEVSYGMAA
jgi:ribosome-binding protein aMBF1 (putative translation factor)